MERIYVKWKGVSWREDNTQKFLSFLSILFSLCSCRAHTCSKGGNLVIPTNIHLRSYKLVLSLPFSSPCHSLSFTPYFSVTMTNQEATTDPEIISKMQTLLESHTLVVHQNLQKYICPRLILVLRSYGLTSVVLSEFQEVHHVLRRQHRHLRLRFRHRRRLSQHSPLLLLVVQIIHLCYAL